jgi:hypothetical protein
MILDLLQLTIQRCYLPHSLAVSHGGSRLDARVSCAGPKCQYLYIRELSYHSPHNVLLLEDIGCGPDSRMAISALRECVRIALGPRRILTLSRPATAYVKEGW